ncbi:carboxymuconolactone decarboxylase family protein [Anaerotignum neopropionicum]|uniref:Carboxymuconolactone decarboxylase family protein n=2 Tax=Anaerotignum neopropionicum TaxID=36847 RepID=A0A136WCK6_9FIRM|nr:carboxymuconolactone decarboxylase family protein [Anaerotignum neopropionicum]
MSLKFDEQLSRLQKPNRSEMTDEEFAVFEKNVDTMTENWGFINNLFKVLPLNASQYMGFLNFKGSLFNDKCYLSDADKEMMGLVVSSTNGCMYCLTSHGDYLRGMTGDPAWVDQLTYNYRAAKLTKKQRALCDYAYFVTAYPREIDAKQVEDLREAGFNDHEILEAAYIAGFFNYTNRWVSTVEPVANQGHYYHNREKK